MRKFRILPLFVVTVALLLTGCSANHALSSAPESQPTTSPSSPTSLTFEEGVEAVSDAYLAYFNAAVETYDRGDDAGLYQYLDAGMHPVADELIADASAEDYSASGTIRIENSEPGLVITDSESQGFTLHLCQDLSQITVVDAEGAEVTPFGERERSTVTVTAKYVDGQMLLTAVSPREEDICE